MTIKNALILFFSMLWERFPISYRIDHHRSNREAAARSAAYFLSRYLTRKQLEGLHDSLWPLEHCDLDTYNDADLTTHIARSLANEYGDRKETRLTLLRRWTGEGSSFAVSKNHLQALGLVEEVQDGEVVIRDKK